MWARKGRNISESQAADLVGITESDLTEYESGKKKPNLTLLRKIAKKYHYPVVTLFMPEPLPTPPLPRDFRTFEGIRAELSFDSIITIRDIQQAHAAIAELVDDEPQLYHPVGIDSISLSENISSVTSDQRKKLSISFVDQINWSDSQFAFNQFRSVIENQGIFIYVVRAPLSDFRGFSLFEETGLPGIVINGRDEHIEPRIFTLFHEYAHILLRNAGMCDEHHNTTNEIERFCNLFAAEILLPEDGLVDLIKSIYGEIPDDWTNVKIRTVANKAKISQQSFLLRLQELNLIKEGIYEAWLKQWEEQKVSVSKKQISKGGPDWTVRRMYRLGAKFTGTILDALDQGVITRPDVYEFTRVKSEHIEKFRENYFSSISKYERDNQ